MVLRSVGYQSVPLPGVRECIELHLRMGRRTNAAVRCVGVSVNTMQLGKSVRAKYLRDLAKETGLPCVDPLVEGPLLVVFTGARPGATVLALDKLTGKEIWKALDDHVSNSSPIIITSAGRRPIWRWKCSRHRRPSSVSR